MSTDSPSAHGTTAPAAPAARIREPTAVWLSRRDAALRLARTIPARRYPFRTVVSYGTPDPHHPIFKDYTLACGHRYPHVAMRRGPDGRFHIARSLRCPLCAVGEPPRHANVPPGSPNTATPSQSERGAA